ncbi:Concanavalin A-like lectin/glucanases superfamily protein [Abditibacterium utsteinense]|uniref:Concanavalin A-like lectin/glucanases superfamily protein n=1 Tax=Abditibacterium utsteinense TaxID=1960156 RepID=A0A2S8SX62_9BACT|nr:family 43 glycosylhydrolase [Abditibacterium utsteinense]PQV65358.1 Concanavalin A-like lectin/glucanases superfamily protein [Abditibacterium utsteinense]
MTRFSSLLLGGVLLLCGCVLDKPEPAQAKTLAYWRFEDLASGRSLGRGTGVRDDSGADNTLFSANDFTRPVEVADAPLFWIPQSGVANRAGAEFRGNDDLFSRSHSLNAFNFSPTGSNAWTLEFSVRLEAFDGITRLLGRDGNAPGGEKRGSLQLVAADLNGDDKYDLRLEIVDGANQFQDIISPATLQARRWYNVAATATNDEMKLYVDSLDGRGYQLAGKKSIHGALNAVPGPFVLGRGWVNTPTDWMNGRLDEVRLSDQALQPEQFLFSRRTATGTKTGTGATAPPVKAALAHDVKLFIGADPHAVAVGKTYYLYPTGRNIGADNWVFTAFSSPDLKNWTRSAPILNFKDIPWIYADGNPRHLPWAPALAMKNGKFYFYYAVGDQNTTPSRIGVGVADTPTGPFKDSGAPLVTGGNGFEAIDPMVFTDPKTKKSYLYAGGSSGAKLRVWQLSDDMMRTVREVPVNTPPKFTEGAFMHYANGLYYLSYSHGGWHSPSYSVHYATSTSPLGPWTYHGPILVSDETRKGPGHHSFMQDPASKRWFIAYHRWQSATAGGDPFKSGGRSLAIAPFGYEKNKEIAPIKMNDDVPVLH